MRTDGLFNMSSHLIKGWKVGRPLRLIPFGDVHWDSPAHCKEHWSDFLRHARATKDALFLGMGDYTDSYSTSEREIIYDGRLHDSTRERQEKESMGRISAIAKELEFMRGRIIGLLGGNHFLHFSDGTSGDQRLAGLLGARYLGVCAAIRLAFEVRAAKTVSLDVFAHHGKGGGVTAGGRFNAVEKLANICEADIFLMGDNHARGCFPTGDRLCLDHVRGKLILRSRQKWIGRTGSFLKAYEPGRSSYVVDAALPPANLGWIEFIVTPRRSRTDGDRLTLDIQAIQ